MKFKQFLPTIILVGTDEVLSDNSINVYRTIEPIQPRSMMKECQHQKHVWLISGIDSKSSLEAIKDIKEFISTENF